MAAVERAGFASACTTEPRPARLHDHPLLIPRIEIKQQDSLLRFLRKVWLGGACTEAPLVSVVMCAWKPRGDWLHEAVAGVLADDSDLELIVVDDGSPERVEALSRNIEDPRLIVVSKIRVEHGGLSRARNAGISRGRAARTSALPTRTTSRSRRNAGCCSSSPTRRRSSTERHRCVTRTFAL